MNKNVTEVVFILDRSGSMSGLEADTIGGYNSMLKKQKEESGEVPPYTEGVWEDGGGGEREGGEGSQLSKREDAVGDSGVAILWLAHARDSGSAGERRRGGDVRGESVHETDFHPSLDERTFL